MHWENLQSPGPRVRVLNVHDLLSGVRFGARVDNVSPVKGRREAI